MTSKALPSWLNYNLICSFLPPSLCFSFSLLKHTNLIHVNTPWSWSVNFPISLPIAPFCFFLGQPRRLPQTPCLKWALPSSPIHSFTHSLSPPLAHFLQSTYDLLSHFVISLPCQNVSTIRSYSVLSTRCTACLRESNQQAFAESMKKSMNSSMLSCKAVNVNQVVGI